METKEKSLKEMLTIDWHEELVKYATAALQASRSDISEERREREREIARQLRASSPNLDCVLSCLEQCSEDEFLH